MYFFLKLFISMMDKRIPTQKDSKNSWLTKGYIERDLWYDNERWWWMMTLTPQIHKFVLNHSLVSILHQNLYFGAFTTFIHNSYFGLFTTFIHNFYSQPFIRQVLVVTEDWLALHLGTWILVLEARGWENQYFGGSF